MKNNDVVIASAVRTPIGDFGGNFKNVPALELGKTVVKEAVRRLNGLDKSEVEEIIFGNCSQRSDEPNIARCIALEAGFPVETTGFTIQRQCASAMQAIVSGYQEIALGDANVVIVGGVEAMSSIPYVFKGARWGQRLQHGEMTDALWEMLMDPYHKIMMGETAERLAEKYGISREEQDLLALRSHKNALHAQQEGLFDDEIVPVRIPGGRNEVLIKTDEHPRADITLGKLSSLKPVFREEGTVTAGNSSGINDGAAALVLMSARKASAMNITPLASITAYSWAGVEPDLMGYGPVPATKKVLTKAGITMDKIELIELNEAFAAQYLVCERILELNREIVNVNGSGIGLGHPVGATGSRIVVTLIHEMIRRELKKGLATLCVGGGLGMALVLER